MKRVLLIILTSLFIVGCSRYSLMTQDRFSDISIGTPITTIEQEFGPPVEIRSIGKNQRVYEYVERITRGPQVIQQRKYFLVVTDGKVVGKYVRFDNPPPYQAIYSDDLFPDNNT